MQRENGHMEGHYGSIKLMLIMNVGHNCALEMINDPRVDLRDQTRNWWWHFMLQRRWQLKRLVKCSHGYNAGFRALHPPACSMPTCTHHQYACMHAHLSLWLSLCFLRYVIFLFDHFPFSCVLCTCFSSFVLSLSLRHSLVLILLYLMCRYKDSCIYLRPLVVSWMFSCLFSSILLLCV